MAMPLHELLERRFSVDEDEFAALEEFADRAGPLSVVEVRPVDYFGESQQSTLKKLGASLQPMRPGDLGPIAGLAAASRGRVEVGDGLVPAHHQALGAGTVVSPTSLPEPGRTRRPGGSFASMAPLPGARFDHHVVGDSRGVLYGAGDLVACVAEVFRGTRLVDQVAGQRCLAGFRLTWSARLLNLTLDWPTRAGTSQALASGPRPGAQAPVGATAPQVPDREIAVTVAAYRRRLGTGPG